MTFLTVSPASAKRTVVNTGFDDKHLVFVLCFFIALLVILM